MPLRWWVLWLGIALPALVISGNAAPRTSVEVIDAWSRATPPGLTVGVAYLTVINHGALADELLSIRSPLCERVELHESRVAHGMMQMRPLDSVSLAPGQRLVLRPNGTHLMLIGLHVPLVAGARVPLILTFRRAGSVRLDGVIRPIGAT
jgi:copper(I)-binding protein